MVPPGNTARIACAGFVPARSCPAHVRNDVVHVRVAFDRHDLVGDSRCPARRCGRGRCVRGRSASRARRALLDGRPVRARAPRHRRRQTRARARDRTRLHALAANLDPGVPAMNWRSPNPAAAAACERCPGWPRAVRHTTAPASAPARSAHQPLARQVELEHVATTQVLVHAPDTVEKLRGIVVFQLGSAIGAGA